MFRTLVYAIKKKLMMSLLKRRSTRALIVLSVMAGALLISTAPGSRPAFSSDAPLTSWDWPEDRVEIPPYRLSLDTGSAVLCWVTPVPVVSKGTLKSVYGKKEFREKSECRYHKYSFKDLKPSTYYRYDIDGLYTGGFRTPAVGEEFKVVAIGHTHGTEELGRYPDELLVARILELHPDLVLHSGDATYHAVIKEFNEYFFKPFRELLSEAPVYISPSNHDCGTPAVYGISFDNFRRLFPHEYGSEKDGYYSFEYKNAKFIALSYYTLETAEGSEQYKWLRHELEDSRSEFNIVFLGGAQIPEEMLNELFKVLSEYRVDLVLGGDGAGPFRKTISGIPYFFSGTSSAIPHSMYLLEFRGYFFTIKRIDAQGKPFPNDFLVINSKKPKKRVLDLTDQSNVRIMHKNQKVENLNFERIDLNDVVIFSGLKVPSRDFDGVALRVRCKGTDGLNMRVSWRSHEMLESTYTAKVAKNDFFRLQPSDTGAGQDNFVLLKMPSKDPLNGKDYELSEVRLYIFGNTDCTDISIERFELFKE